VSRPVQLWAPLVAYMALITFLPSGIDMSRIHRISDKLLHTGAYVVLGGLALRAFHDGWPRLSARPAVWAVLLTMGYGAADETYQALVPWRDASILDWLADGVGMTLALVLTAAAIAVRSRWIGTAVDGGR
jgi:VanZ family protein